VRPLRIGTRGSPLALWQARAVATALEQHGVPAELVTISTRGDQKQDLPLAAIGGKGVFVKEIHEALLSGEIDLAVHSAKDMPAVSPEGLTIGAVLAREDPRDALVLPGSAASAPQGGGLPTLLGGSTLIGTGSPRRIAQLRRIFPQARFDPIRGNVDTRLRKLDAGAAQALVLACAGLRRLGLGQRITTAIEVSDCVPAPGQGIIAIEARRIDNKVLERLDALNHPPARIALAAEQAVVAELGGGCQLPLGAFAAVSGQMLSIRAIAASTNGTAIIESTTTGDPNDPVEAGRRLGRELASRGARELLNT
jgi:hydroxymethylbilane synthase